MNNSRVSMHTQNETASYVKFDWYVNYKPTKWVFSIYISETKQSTEVTKMWWALITRRNVALASSKADNPVSSQDFDGFDEKLFMKETIKWGKVLSKGLTYTETKEKADSLFYTNSFRLGSAYYLVTEKWAVLKLILTWTTRSKVNALLDDMWDIDFLTFEASKDTIVVWSWSRSQEVHELKVTWSTKEYTRVAIDKINSTVNTLKEILKNKTSWSSTVWTTESTATTADAEEVFSDASSDDLPI